MFSLPKRHKHSQLQSEFLIEAVISKVTYLPVVMFVYILQILQVRFQDLKKITHIQSWVVGNLKKTQYFNN